MRIKPVTLIIGALAALAIVAIVTKAARLQFG